MYGMKLALSNASLIQLLTARRRRLVYTSSQELASHEVDALGA